MREEIKLNDIHIEEKILKPKNGVPVLIGNSIAVLATFILGIRLFMMAPEEVLHPYYGIITESVRPGFILAGIICMVYAALIGPFIFKGLKIVNPNEALVLTLFGNYMGSVKKAGFYFVNPFASAFAPLVGSADQTALVVAPEAKAATAAAAAKKEATQINFPPRKRISLKAITHSNRKQKVNDALGNPIEIGIVVIWRVVDTAKAVFSVENYPEFVSIQADSSIRNIARLYPYDVAEGGDEMTLRGSSTEVAEKLEKELQDRVEKAGILILEARITHLAYAPEIAAAMLQRQQASAIIDARKMIVEGAVGMVEMALNQLSDGGVVDLDEERKASMISNLLVVLCGNRDAQPVVNSGSIY